MNVSKFQITWRQADLTESSGAQQHFCDLCELFDHPKPAEADPKGEWFTFEKGAAKHGGGDGWADVWKKDFFAWEYKGKHKDLDAAYDQLLKYREALGNPPLLCVCDMDRMVIHTNFTATATQVHEIRLLDLKEPDNLEILRAVFHDPSKLKPGVTREAITKEAAQRLANVADLLRQRGLDPHSVARFLDRIVFCLFAEDIGLLPEDTFTQILGEYRHDPEQFTAAVAELFARMAAGGRFGVRRIRHFDGNLFEDAEVLQLEYPEIESIWAAAKLDWGAVDASIFGTLFERGMDPAKRAQLGAHYTSRADIETLVEPVVMAPLRREWADLRETLDCLLSTGEKSAVGSQQSADEIGNRQSEIGNRRRLSGPAIAKARHEGEMLINRFLQRLSKVHVLDPACGSGNFLYVTLQKLKDLEKEAILYAVEHSLGDFTPAVGPWQLHGIEISPYAFELAQLTVWIGYLQWLIHNGFGVPHEPILRPMHTFECKDAILQVCSAGPGVCSAGFSPSPGGEKIPPEGGTTNTEPEWPKVDFIVGNPPFLGGKMLRRELGDDYVDALFGVYKGRVPAEADLCCYWFEKARAQVESKLCERAGLLATQGIRGGASREVLKRIKVTGDIFFAESDRPWVLDGANVHISMVAFDAGTEERRTLNGAPVRTINPNLSDQADISLARPLPENAAMAFMGTTKQGPFDVSQPVACKWLAEPNPHGRPSSDVLIPWVNGSDIVKRPRHMWLVDFFGMREEEASLYEEPFNHVRTNAKEFRELNPRDWYREEWWQLYAQRPEMRAALAPLPRFVVTPRVSKFRLFAWLSAPTQPDSATFAFARSDDHFFGVLHSRLHEVWALRLGTRLETRPRYTPTTCFDTFPFPWPGDVARRSAADSGVRASDAEAAIRPGGAGHDEQEAAIGEAARELNELRERWLNPPEWVKEEVLEFPGTVGGPWTRFIVEEGSGLQVTGAGGEEPSALVPRNPEPGTRNLPSGIGLVRYPRLVPRDAECAGKLKKRTLTNLYNQRPTWLALAHKKLDEAVFAAYAWDPAMSDEQILEKLLALNLERAAEEAGA